MHTLVVLHFKNSFFLLSIDSKVKCKRHAGSTCNYLTTSKGSWFRKIRRVWCASPIRMKWWPNTGTQSLFDATNVRRLEVALHWRIRFHFLQPRSRISSENCCLYYSKYNKQNNNSSQCFVVGVVPGINSKRHHVLLRIFWKISMKYTSISPGDRGLPTIFSAHSKKFLWFRRSLLQWWEPIHQKDLVAD